MQDKKTRFIISTKSGANDNFQEIEKVIKDTYKDRFVDIKFTNTEFDVKNYSIEWANEHGSNGLVFILGGDGASNEAASALYNTQTSLGVIPTGTANDFAKTLYKTKKIDLALVKRLIRASVNATESKIDLIRVNDTVALNVASMGYDTVVLEHAYKNINRWSKIGRHAYTLAILQTLFHQKTYNLAYDLEDANGKTFKGEMNSIISVIANARFYGGGFNPTPAAEIDDGLGDFFIAESLNIFELIPLLIKFKDGKHLSHKKVHYFNFTKGSIKTLDGSEIMGNVDGRIFKSNSMDFEVLKGALNFIQISNF